MVSRPGHQSEVTGVPASCGFSRSPDARRDNSPRGVHVCAGDVERETLSRVKPSVPIGPKMLYSVKIGGPGQFGWGAPRPQIGPVGQWRAAYTSGHRALAAGRRCRFRDIPDPMRVQPGTVYGDRDRPSNRAHELHERRTGPRGVLEPDRQ